MFDVKCSTRKVSAAKAMSRSQGRCHSITGNERSGCEESGGKEGPQRSGRVSGSRDGGEGFAGGAGVLSMAGLWAVWSPSNLHLRRPIRLSYSLLSSPLCL